MSTMKDAEGPFILWINNGYEGWSPTSYPTLKEALMGERYNSEWVVTRLIEFEVVEKAEAA